MERLTSKVKYKDGRRLKKNWQATTHEGADAIYEASQKLAEYEDIGLTPEEIKKSEAESLKAIGELQLLAIKKQKENEQARTDAWSMMERWSDAKDKLQELENVYQNMMKELDSYRQAEEQGLLIKLPCKVGDTVWQTVIDIRKSKPGRVHYDIVEAEVTRYSIDYFFPTFWTKAKAGGCENQLTFNAIGKTVFLTREEAEATLKEGVSE